MSFAAVAEAERRTPAPFGRRLVQVTGRVQIGPYVVIDCEDEGPVARPGQFYMLAAAERWGGGEAERPFLPRAFSVMRTRQGSGVDWRILEFLFEDVGPGTNRLCELEAGDGLFITGPLGIGFSPPAPGARPVLVGGGVGIAPLLTLEDSLDAATTLLGFRNGAYAQAAARFAAPRVATDDGSAGHHGLVTDLLLEELDSEDHIAVYACGPPAMLEAVRALCAERGQEAQLALESGMACGYGACFGCVVPTKDGYVRLCVDGPVLDADALDTALVPGAGH